MSGQIVNQHVALSVVNGECRFCKRTGFPILPVRYAVCQRNDANQQIPELSEDRVKAFTDIKLDQTLENGKRTTRVVPSEVKEEIAHSTSSQVNKYILRQLRSGYLYLFDKDNPDGMYWSAFAITADGKYYQFPVKQPPSLDKMAMPCTLETGNRDGESDEEKVTRVKNESLQASLVTITTPDKSGDVYYAYTEHAWPEGFLDEVKSRILSGDPWCDKYLQKFNVPDWKAGVAQDHAFSLEELDQVAEYSPGAAGLDEQFWSSGPKRDLYSPEEMKQTMSERLRYASTDYEGRGLILAVNDEIGIIQELNAYRHQALAAVEDFFDPGEGKKQISDERRRKLLCKQAIDAFQKNFERSYQQSTEKSLQDAIDTAKKNKEEYLESVQGEDFNYSSTRRSVREKSIHNAKLINLDEAIKQAEEEKSEYYAELDEVENEKNRLQSEIEELELNKKDWQRRVESKIEETAGVDGKSPYDNLRNDTTYDSMLRSKNHELKYTLTRQEELSNKHRHQLTKLYDVDALEAFDADFLEYTKHCEKLLAVQDSDYSLWVLAHLEAVSERYSQNDFDTGLELCGLYANALRGGILSSASGSMWKTFSDKFLEDDSTILRVLLFNNIEYARQVASHIGSLDENEQLQKSELIAWGEKFTEWQAMSSPLENKILTDQQREARLASVGGTFMTIVGNALSALLSYSHSLTLNDQVDARHDQKRTLKLFILSSQIMYMARPSVHTKNAEIPLMVNAKVTLADYYQWLRRVLDSEGGDRSQGVDKTTALKSLNGKVGNFTAPVADSETVISVTLPRFIPVNENLSGDEQSYQFKDEVKRIDDKDSELYKSYRDITGSLAGQFGGNLGGIAALGLASWSFWISIDKILSDDKSGTDLSKVLGAGVSFASLTMKAMETINKVSTHGTLGFANSSNAVWKITGNVLGVAAGIISIWDGVKKLTEALDAKRLGQSVAAENTMVLGGVAAMSGIAAIVVIGFSFTVGLVVSVIFGFLALVLGATLITLVSPSVQMWVNRSLVGFQKGSIAGFDDMVDEQSSLEMVFKGVVVEISWTHAIPNTFAAAGSPYAYLNRDYYNGENVSVSVNISVPVLRDIEISLVLRSEDNNSTLFDWDYAKNSSSKSLSPVLDVLSSDNSAESQPIFKLSDGNYLLNWNQDYNKKEIGDNLRLSINLNDNLTAQNSSDSLLLRL